MKSWIRIALAIGLLALVISLADWRAILEVLKDVDATWVTAALLLAVADRVVLNLRWQVLLVARGIPIGFLRLFRVQLAANALGSFFPSSIGVDALRIAALCRGGEAPAKVIAATLVDRATIAIATLVLGSVTILLLAESRIPHNVSRFVFAATLVAALGCAVCLHPSIRRRVRLTLLPRVPERLRHIVSGVADAALAYRHDWRVLGWVAVTTALTFFVRILFAKAVCLACGVDVSFANLLLVIPILWIIMMLPITFGGIGVQEVSYVGLMSLLGVGPAVAVSMSLIEHVVVHAACLPGVFFIGDLTSRSRVAPAQPIRVKPRES